MRGALPEEGVLLLFAPGDHLGHRADVVAEVVDLLAVRVERVAVDAVDLRPRHKGLLQVLVVELVVAAVHFEII